MLAPPRPNRPRWRTCSRDRGSRSSRWRPCSLCSPGAVQIAEKAANVPGAGWVTTTSCGDHSAATDGDVAGARQPLTRAAGRFRLCGEGAGSVPMAWQRFCPGTRAGGERCGDSKDSGPSHDGAPGHRGSVSSVVGHLSPRQPVPYQPITVPSAGIEPLQVHRRTSDIGRYIFQINSADHASAPVRGGQPAKHLHRPDSGRTKPVRRSVDLSPTYHIKLTQWCAETADVIGTARVTGQDVIRGARRSVADGREPRSQDPSQPQHRHLTRGLLLAGLGVSWAVLAGLRRSQLLAQELARRALQASLALLRRRRCRAGSRR